MVHENMFFCEKELCNSTLDDRIVERSGKRREPKHWRHKPVREETVVVAKKGVIARVKRRSDADLFEPVVEDGAELLRGLSAEERQSLLDGDDRGGSSSMSSGMGASSSGGGSSSVAAPPANEFRAPRPAWMPRSKRRNVGVSESSSGAGAGASDVLPRRQVSGTRAAGGMRAAASAGRAGPGRSRAPDRNRLSFGDEEG